MIKDVYYNDTDESTPYVVTDFIGFTNKSDLKPGHYFSEVHAIFHQGEISVSKDSTESKEPLFFIMKRVDFLKLLMRKEP